MKKVDDVKEIQKYLDEQPFDYGFITFVFDTLFHYGTNEFLDEKKVKESIDEINKKHDKYEAEQKEAYENKRSSWHIPLMSREFEIGVIESCCYLAKHFDTYDLILASKKYFKQ